MILGLADVRDWLKGFGIGEHFYIGKLDAKQEKSIGVYQRTSSGRPRVAIGGLDLTKYDVKQISILVHWSNNARETEEAARTLFDKLRAIDRVTIGCTRIDYLCLEVSEPVDVGTDDTGVYERTILFDLYYERM